MRVLLSTIGSRGDVQPLVALASHLKALGQEVRVCVPPDFREWIESLGIPVTPIGPEVPKFAASRPTPAQAKTQPTPNERRHVVIPDHYDQHYWAQRVQALGIGTANASGAQCDV